MKTTKNQRLRLVVTQLRLLNLIKHDSDFAEQIGWNRSNLSAVYNGKRAVSEKLINGICNKFDFVNPRYLRGEESTMLLKRPNLSIDNFLICEREGYSSRFNKLCSEAMSQLKEKLRTLPDCRCELMESVYLYIDTCSDYGHITTLNAKDVMLISNTIVVFSEDIDIERKEKLISGDDEAWDRISPDEVWVSGGEWYAEWEGLLEIVDEVLS